MRTVVFLIIVSLLSCGKERPPATEKAVSKKVNYHIFAARNYAGTQVEEVRAELRLQVRLINYKTGEQQLVWDSLLPVRRIVDFPLYDNKIIVSKTWPILNSHQKLNGAYSVTYRDGQTVQQAASSDEVVPGMDSITLEADM